MGCACGSSMASSTGSSRLSETTTSTFANGSAPCSFQAMPSACRAISSDALLRVDAISFHVFFIADVADRIGVRIGVGQMRAFARIRVGENHVRADFVRRADGLDKRIGRLDRHVDGVLGVIARALVRIENDATSPAAAPPRAHNAVRSVTGSSSATTCGRSRRIAWRTSMANSSRPGTTGR